MDLASFKGAIFGLSLRVKTALSGFIKDNGYCFGRFGSYCKSSNDYGHFTVFIGGGFIAWQPQANWPLLLLPLILLIRMALNAINGILAREYG